MKSANRIWFVQFLSLFFGGLPFLLLPALVMSVTTGRPIGAIPLIEIDQVRMVGAASIGLSLATLLAMTRQVLAWQRGMAAIFIVFFFEWSTILLLNQEQGYYRAAVPFFTFWPGYVFGFINLAILLQPGRNEPVKETRVDPAPTRLRWLWAIQGVYYLIEVAFCLVAAEWTLGWVTGRGAGDASLTPIAIEQVRIVSAWTLSFALLSVYASLEHRIRDWRQYRWVFLIALLVRSAGIAANVHSGSFEPLAGLTLAVPALFFAYLGFRWTLGQAPSEFREDPGLRPLRNADSDAPSPHATESGVVWLWVVQTLVFSVTGLICLFAPRAALSWVAADPIIPEFASDALRISGALIIGLAGFNVFALMMSRTVFRRRFAIVFFIALAASCIVLWLEVANHLYTGSMAGICSVLTLLALLNLHWAIRRPPGAMSQDDSGVAGSKPASAFLGWLAQVLLLSLGGLALLFATESVLTFLSRDMSPPFDGATAAHRMIHGQWHLVGVLSASVAVLTGFGMASQRDPVWRGFAFFGSFAFVVLTLALAFVTFDHRYHVASLSLVAVTMILVYLNWWIRRQPSNWTTRDASHDLDSWTLLDLVAGPLMALSVLFTKRRSSHLMGAGARGTFTVSENVGMAEAGVDRSFPPNDFFTPGRSFDIQARFANLTELDDAALDVRGCSIKFSECRLESPLDLLMNTGTYCPAFNLVTFAGFVASKFLPVAGSKAVVRSNLPAREGGIAGLRRGPDSYSQLHYHSQIVRHWVDLEGVRHLVRYRCLPHEDIPESGLPSAEDASHIWLRDRLPDERRATNYLREEIRGRIEAEGVKMRLQAQFHTPAAGDSDDWYNASVEWDERDCPWIDVGRLELDGVLSNADTELLQFDPSHHPMTLGIPRSTSALDYRSMGDSEARVVRALQRFRLWMYKTFGPPALGAVETASESRR